MNDGTWSNSNAKRCRESESIIILVEITFVVVILPIIIIFFFFYIYLPFSSMRNDTVGVPISVIETFGYCEWMSVLARSYTKK